VNYKEIVQNVLVNGVPKQATRYDSDGKVIPVENGTIGTFCEIFRHDMSKSFPLTTLRKMPWRSIRVELEGFIKGITDKVWYQVRRCGFWNEWSNPKEYEKLIGQEIPLSLTREQGHIDIYGVPTDSPTMILNKIDAQFICDDLGPIYGYQWRSFGQSYDNGQSFDDLCIDNKGIPDGFDQLKSITDKLKTSPYDRRMVCSAWNPNQMDMQALPPCHWAFNVVVYGNKLNLIWHQRSCDLALGVGANIASYALLLLLLCEESGLEPGELVGTLADCHLYENTLTSAKLMVQRDENPLPSVKIKRKEDGSFSIFNWEWNEVELIGYDPHPAIDMGSVTV